MADEKHIGNRTGEGQSKKNPNQKDEQRRRGPQSDRQDQGNTFTSSRPDEWATALRNRKPRGLMHTLRIGKPKSITIGICDTCQQQFKSYLPQTVHAEWEIQTRFDEHTCKRHFVGCDIAILAAKSSS